MSGKMLLPRHADESKHPDIEIPFSFEIVQQLHNQLKVIGANTY